MPRLTLKSAAAFFGTRQGKTSNKPVTIDNLVCVHFGQSQPLATP
jgi:hypothetical protein